MTPFDETAVLNLLYESETRLTVRQYISKIKQLLGTSSRQAKQVVQTLVDRQELAYHYLYGSTYIEQSFSKPVRITDHFTLVPAAVTPKKSSSHFPILIQQGISFGSGQHPTTRLCLESIDNVFFDSSLSKASLSKMGADIGTGSGILALALCMAGLGCCRAYEIDPVSVNEAKKNISINKLEKRICVIDDYFSPQPDRFSIICANLRYPTLMNLSHQICDSLEKEGILILSGIRPDEKIEILQQYQNLGLTPIRETDRNNWSCIAFIKQTTG